MDKLTTDKKARLHADIAATLKHMSERAPDLSSGQFRDFTHVAQEEHARLLAEAARRRTETERHRAE